MQLDGFLSRSPLSELAYPSLLLPPSKFEAGLCPRFPRDSHRQALLGTSQVKVDPPHLFLSANYTGGIRNLHACTSSNYDYKL